MHMYKLFQLMPTDAREDIFKTVKISFGQKLIYIHVILFKY